MVPLIGSVAAEAIAHAMDARQMQRQHDFNVAVAQALARVDDGTLKLDDIVRSDDFIAGVTRAQRIAAETASERKRVRLANAVANEGSWAPFSRSEREQFSRLVGEFGELHIWLLHYFVDPAAWLKNRDRFDGFANIVMAGIGAGLSAAFEQPETTWGDPVRQAAGGLDRNGLASIPLTTTMSPDGIFSPRTSTKGTRFLAFLNEPNHISVDPLVL